MNTTSAAPSTSEEFNKVYNSVISPWMWSDIRIPKELEELVIRYQPRNSLELGCGLGIFSRFMAEQGIQATGVDFSSIAIQKAKRQIIEFENKPTFIVGDVTNLECITEKFDVTYDIGCFHCLNEDGEQKYVSEVYRLLKPGGVHLMWAIDSSPIGIKLHPDYISQVFDTKFELVRSNFSRRRIVASHWYWLVRGE